MKTLPSLHPFLFGGPHRVCAKKTKPKSCMNLKKQYTPSQLEELSSSSQGSNSIDANNANTTTIPSTTTASSGSCSVNHTRKRKTASTKNSNVNLVLKNKNLEGIDVSTDLALCDETWNWALKKMKVNVERETKNVKAAVSSARFRSCTYDHEEILPMGVSTELKLFEYPFTIKKTLMKSDVGQLSRLLLGLELVHTHVLPVLGSVLVAEVHSDKGREVSVRDLDTMTDHHLIFKKWVKPNSYVFINGWRAEFVKRRNLKAGDKIRLFWVITIQDAIFMFLIALQPTFSYRH